MRTGDAAEDVTGVPGVTGELVLDDVVLVSEVSVGLSLHSLVMAADTSTTVYGLQTGCSIFTTL